MIVDSNDVRQWFGEYANAFVACGRGESGTASLLAYYGVPLLLTTDDGFFALTSDDQIVAAVQQQVDGMRAAGYDRSEILGSEVTVLNATSALYRQTFSRHRRDGSEISQLTATYLVTDGPIGRRISVLAVHSPLIPHRAYCAPRPPAEVSAAIGPLRAAAEVIAPVLADAQPRVPLACWTAGTVRTEMSAASSTSRTTPLPGPPARP